MNLKYMDYANMTPEKKEKIHRGLRIALIVFLAAALANLAFGYRENGRVDKAENVISVTGHGEISAVPDIANIYVTIREEAKTVKEAQAKVTEVEKKTLDLLKENSIAEKDIKTANASFNPKYEYKYSSQKYCATSYCPPTGSNVIVGYEAYESLTVKIRNTDDAGKIMQGLGAIGITELSGPSFAIDNEDNLKIEARKKAIEDAKSKAKSLAKDLGIKLGHITSFAESGNYPTPMYAKTMMADSAVSGAGVAELPKGENTVNSDVTITYEIK